MTYATTDDLARRFGSPRLLELADRDADGVADAGVVETALADAGQAVNGYVAGRYRVPLDPVPDQVVRWTADIAWYFLHGDSPPDGVAANYKAAITALRDVQAGRITLVAAGIETPAAADDDYAVLVAAPPASAMPGDDWS